VGLLVRIGGLEVLADPTLAGSRGRVMADVTVNFNGQRTNYVGGGKSYSYRVGQAGTLHVLAQEDGQSEWTFEQEYSPAGWHSVHGKRFMDDPTTLTFAGTKGRAYKAPEE
jgi:hypothetical protein